MHHLLLIWGQTKPQTSIFQLCLCFCLFPESLARRTDARSVAFMCSTHPSGATLKLARPSHLSHTRARLHSLYQLRFNTLSSPFHPLTLFHLPLFLMPCHSAREEKGEKGEMNLGHKRPCISSCHSCHNTFLNK